MEHHIKLYLLLLTIITIVSVVFRKSTVPTSLLLVIAGMLLSYIPDMPYVSINPEVILDGFLPLLLYTASYSSSWRDIKSNARAISLMSIGHVLFITVLVAVAIHYMIPRFGWPLSFILGAVISPPDDVAILSIAEKVRMPSRLVTVLRGEALLNDATALIIFKFALVALLTHQFSIIASSLDFITIIVVETIYGIAIGYVLGEIRLRINEPILQVLISILTPYLAYLPAEYVFGSGVVATVVSGIYIGQKYWSKFTPDVRLNARSVWSTLEFTLQCILFLLVGLNMEHAMQAIAGMPAHKLLTCTAMIIFVIIAGRFLWVYPATYIPRLLSPSLRKRDPYPPWQYPFIISWAGMRGGISLAAALAVPALPSIDGINPKDLLVFFVFASIVATLLIQGLSLPWIIRILGMHTHGSREKEEEHQDELRVRMEMNAAVLQWLKEREKQFKDNASMTDEIRLQLKVYASVQQYLERQLKYHMPATEQPTDIQIHDLADVLSDILLIERRQLELCWQADKITQQVKTKLEKQLDLRAQHIQELSS